MKLVNQYALLSIYTYLTLCNNVGEGCVVFFLLLLFFFFGGGGIICGLIVRLVMHLFFSSEYYKVESLPIIFKAMSSKNKHDCTQDELK